MKEWYHFSREGESIPTSQSAQWRLKLSCLPSVSSPVSLPPPPSLFSRLANFNHIWEQGNCLKGSYASTDFVSWQRIISKEAERSGFDGHGSVSWPIVTVPAASGWDGDVQGDIVEFGWGCGESVGGKEHRYVGKWTSFFLLFPSLFQKVLKSFSQM